MGESMGDAIAVEQDWIYKAWLALQALCPEHELLRFYEMRGETLYFVKGDAPWEKFDERFPPINPSPMHGAHPPKTLYYSYLRYRIALEKAHAERRSGSVSHEIVVAEHMKYGLGWFDRGLPIDCSSIDAVQKTVRLAVAQMICESAQTIFFVGRRWVDKKTQFRAIGQPRLATVYLDAHLVATKIVIKNLSWETIFSATVSREKVNEGSIILVPDPAPTYDVIRRMAEARLVQISDR